VFGERNFVGTLIWQRAKGGGNSKKVVKGHEYVLCYSKFNDVSLTQKGDKSIEHIRKWESGKNKDKYVFRDDKLFFINDDVVRRVFGKYDKNEERRCEYENLIKFKGQNIKNEIDEKITNGEFVLKKNKEGLHYICRLEEVGSMRQIMYTILQGFLSEVGKNDLANLDMEDLFDYPKPVNLIKVLLDSVLNKSATILDFFAGSGTTGHAVLELNKEDGGNRKFILVTNNGDEKSEHKIAEKITYERLKKVMNGYVNKKGDRVDGLGGNLEYMKCELIEKDLHKDNLQISIANNSVETVALREGVFEKKEVKQSAYTILQGVVQNITHSTAIYTSIDDSYIDDFKEELEKLSGEKSVYINSLMDYSHVFLDVKNINIKDLPEVK
jgi:adenine-specific DNA-methyltransferase